MNRRNSYGIDVLKAAAALLIINSHLEAFYSRSYLSADGLLGNTIFFFTTGYTLAGSLDHRHSERLPAFLWKRLSRLYPSVWIVMLLLPSHPVPWGSPSGFFHAFGYPTYFTFVALVLPMYPVFFLFWRSTAMRRGVALVGWFMLLVATGLAMRSEWLEGRAGVAWSTHGLPLTFHFFGAMLLGGHFARKAGQAQSPRRFGPDLAVFAGLALAYIVLRLLAVPAFSARAGAFADYAALGSLVLTVLLGVSVVSLVDGCDVGWLRSGPLMAVTGWLAAHTWETYLLHYGVSYFGWIKALNAPWSILAVFAVTLMLAPVLKRLAALCLPRTSSV
jgi:peptidoglycan/LPS O-acetylase OafA/YrhL